MSGACVSGEKRRARGRAAVPGHSSGHGRVFLSPGRAAPSVPLSSSQSLVCPSLSCTLDDGTARSRRGGGGLHACGPGPCGQAPAAAIDERPSACPDRRSVREKRRGGARHVGVVRTLRSAPRTSPSPDARASHQAQRRPIAPGPAQRKGQRMLSCLFRPLITLCPKPSLNLAAPPPSPHPPPPPTRPSPPPSGGTPTRPCPTCARSRAWTRCWASSRRPGTRW